jgi:hypothetical protein
VLGSGTHLDRRREWAAAICAATPTARSLPIARRVDPLGTEVAGADPVVATGCVATCPVAGGVVTWAVVVWATCAVGVGATCMVARGAIT